MSKRVEIKLTEPSDSDIITFLDSDRRRNSDIIRDALRLYMNSHAAGEDERFKKLMREVLSEYNIHTAQTNGTPKNSKMGSTGFSPKKL